MNSPRFLRTISFRLTLLYAALFAASTAVLFGIVYWIASATLYDQMRLALESEMASLTAKSTTTSVEGLASEIAQRLSASRAARQFLYALTDSSGRRLAGNLKVAKSFDGWRDLSYDDEMTGSGDEADHSLLALGRFLPNGSHLIIAMDVVRLEEADELIVRAFLWAAGATLLLAFIGGFGLSQGFLRRVDEINWTVRAIMRGDLSDRIQSRGTGDELDQLGRNLNEMLDRLQVLMDGLKQVSNDIAHDLRTPLSRLKQRLEVARIEAASVKDYEEVVDLALNDADLALSTFSAVLRIAQIEAGTRRGHFTDLDLSALMTGLAMTYAAVAEDAGKCLISSIEPDLHLSGDRELLTQLFVNLIENALRHTPAGARVTLSLRSEDEGLVAEIADNGPGIAETERRKVFRRFYRLEASRSTPGSGLGLALAVAVTDLHAATIELADNDPGLKVILCFRSDHADRAKPARRLQPSYPVAGAMGIERHIDD